MDEWNPDLARMHDAEHLEELAEGFRKAVQFDKPEASVNVQLAVEAVLMSTADQLAEIAERIRFNYDRDRHDEVREEQA